jgi:hypothetical protein
MPMALTRHHGYPNVGNERFSKEDLVPKAGRDRLR